MTLPAEFSVTLDDVIRLMDGHPPPPREQFEQWGAYWKILEERLPEAYTSEELSHFYLIAGCSPVEFRDWEMNWKWRSK
jgi:hypothetical protein